MSCKDGDLETKIDSGFNLRWRTEVPRKTWLKGAAGDAPYLYDCTTHNASGTSPRSKMIRWVGVGKKGISNQRNPTHRYTILNHVTNHQTPHKLVVQFQTFLHPL